MSGREPTRHQLSSRLTYSAQTPAFIVKLQKRVAGNASEDEEEEEWDGTGRPPIPRRPPIPERPADDPGSADEEAGEEKPVVVVLKEGKHLTEREAENIRRQERGLPPLPDPTQTKADDEKVTPATDPPSKMKSSPAGLSFSSSSGSGARPAVGKRKAVGRLASSDNKEPPKKKAKNKKALLSFGDDV